MDEEYHFSAPGRVEIGGNHTDHQHGRVLAAAINLESKAIVRRNCEGKIRVISEGYDPVEIDVWDPWGARGGEEHHRGADTGRSIGIYRVRL